MKIVVAHGVGFSREALARMAELAEVQSPGDDSEAALLEAVRDADSLVVGISPPVPRHLIEAAPRLRHVGRLGVGVDTVDIAAATERGVMVTNVQDVTSDSVAEFTMALLLGLAKNIPRCDASVRGGRWGDRLELIGANVELAGKTHGIVGLGRIGGRVAVRCQAFGMRVLYFKRNRDLGLEASLGVAYAPFDDLLRHSDSISVHLPLTPETTNLFGAPQFALMKPSSFLINQARGRVVNEAALVDALRDGRIGGYATDVYADEPPDPAGELFTFRNVVATPHLGGGTREARLRACMTIAEDAILALHGEIPKNLVNREVLQRIRVSGGAAGDA